MAQFGRGLCAMVGAAALAALLAIPTSAWAEPALLTPHGDYDFYTFAQKDGRPVCTEHWQFKNDNTLIVHSGQEIVAKQFHVTVYRGGETPLYLIGTTTVSTNGLPDCLGNATTRPGQEQRLLVYRGLHDGIVLCWAPAADAPPPAAGDTLILRDFARLDPTPDGGNPRAAPGGD
jgi:hypothetical protein